MGRLLRLVGLVPAAQQPASLAGLSLSRGADRAPEARGWFPSGGSERTRGSSGLQGRAHSQ